MRAGHACAATTPTRATSRACPPRLRAGRARARFSSCATFTGVRLLALRHHHRSCSSTASARRCRPGRGRLVRPLRGAHRWRRCSIRSAPRPARRARRARLQRLGRRGAGARHHERSRWRTPSRAVAASGFQSRPAAAPERRPRGRWRDVERRTPPPPAAAARRWPAPMSRGAACAEPRAVAWKSCVTSTRSATHARRRRRPVRPQGGGQHLHPHHEPDAGGAGGLHRRARGAASHVAGAGLRARRRSPTRSRPSPRPATTSSPARAVRRHLQPVRAHLPQYRHQARFADYRDPALRAADRRRTAVFCESIGNPLGNDHRHGPSPRSRPQARRAADRRQHGASSPYLCRPFEHGADIVAHSLTSTSAAIGTSHRRRDRRLQRFRGRSTGTLQAPERGRRQLHGVVYTEALGPAAFIAARVAVPLRNMARRSPFNARRILQGVERWRCMDQHLRERAGDRAVPASHPEGGLGQLRRPADHPTRAGGKHLGGAPRHPVTFGVRGAGEGRRAGPRRAEALTRLVNIGDRSR